MFIIVFKILSSSERKLQIKYLLEKGSSCFTSTDDFVILYPRAFNNPKDLDRVIAHELVHVLVMNEWKDLFEGYKKNTDWNLKKGNEFRVGEFVEVDGKMSADEDFANNVEYFLFDPNKLKEKSSDIFKWLQKNMGLNLKLERGCSNVK